MTVSSPFVIKELTGDKREIRMTERGGPYRPFQLSGMQRVELEALPGVPERTATVLGPTEQPTTITGYWKSMFLGVDNRGRTSSPPFLVDNRQISTAREAVKLIDSVRLLGQLLEVTWLDTLRRGFITRFDQTWHNSEDVEWSLTFEWISRGEPTAPAVFITDTSMGDSFANVDSLFGFLDKIQLPALPLADEILSGLQELTNGIGNLVLDMEDSLQNFTDKILSPVRAIRGLVATLQSLEDETGLMMEFLVSQPASAFSSTDPSEQGYSEKQSLALYREELRAWAAELQRTAVESRTNLVAQISTTLLATYTARQGEDLRDVAQQFYGTPFEWRRLLIFNDFQSSLLEAGQLVLVPPLSVEQAAQQAPGN